MKTVSRLIETFIPTKYDLSITLERQSRTFHGTVAIHGAAPKASQSIRLHSKDLSIKSVTVDGKKAIFSHDEHDELVVEHSFSAAKHIVVVVFEGTITDSMHGLYPCYFAHNGVKKELLATQFESHHAREVFPCIDEPQAKAVFDLTLTTETGVTVISNQPIKRQREENGKLVTSFETTPLMSTYLLAWVVGELHKVTAKTKNDTEVSVWSTPVHAKASLGFSLDIAVRAIEFFEDYFGVPYPLPKADHVALPDFSSGAMENWGLITYRESALIIDPNKSSIASKRQAALVITHELSHQWFGNLVTMEWWNDLWLNESFANMMEYLAVDALQPDWNIWLEHASYETLISLRRDSIDGVQAIQTDVHHPDEISTLFDGAIVYAKGGRMIRMLQQFVGDEAFRQGLQIYFKKHSYKNTVANDLWMAISKAANKDISDFMNSWIKQPGFPVLHATKSDKKITLRQERFFVGPHQASDSIWPIPLNSPCSEMPEILDVPEITVTRHHTTPLRFNAGGSAHFITHYSPELLENLLNNLDDIPEIDRLQLLHEQTLLAQAGIISTADLIPILEHFKHETAEAVWDIIAVTINELKKFVENDPSAEAALKQLAADIAAPHFQELGWKTKPGEPEANTKRRATLISLMLYSEQPEVVNSALEMYGDGTLDKIDSDIRSSIISVAIRYSDNKDRIFESLITAYRKLDSPELQQDIASGLTATRELDAIKNLLNIINQTDIVRSQDFIFWFVQLIRNRHARDLTWQWARENWDWIDATFSGDKSLDAYPRFIANALRTNQHLSEYQEFFTPLKDHPVLRRNIAMGISELEGRIELLERDAQKVIDALTKQ